MLMYETADIFVHLMSIWIPDMENGHKKGFLAELWMLTVFFRK